MSVFGCPAEIALRRLDGRDAHLDVLVVLAVVLVRGHIDDRCGLGILAQHRELLRDADGALGEIADGDAVVGIADVENAAARAVVLVLQNGQERLDRIVDEGERALLAAAVNEFDRALVEHVGEELREDTRAALFRLLDVVEVGTDEVERAEQRVVEVVTHAVGVDDAIEHLLGGRVDPALLVDRSVDQRARLLIEHRVRRHAVDFRGRREDQSLVVLHTLAHDLEVRLEVELEHPQRMRHILRRVGDGDQRHDGIALLDVVLHPLLVDRDVAFDEVKATRVLAADPRACCR